MVRYEGVCVQLSHAERARCVSSRWSHCRALILLGRTGISASSKLPFSPPIEFRSLKREVNGRHEKDAVLEGKCHQCQKFIPLEGVKLGDIKVRTSSFMSAAADDCFR